MRKYLYFLDILVVIIFVAIGRHAHKHGETLAGLCSTAWPFLVGCVVGMALLAFRKAPYATLRSGAVQTIVTVTIGMVLRVCAGQGTAVAFIIVALCFLGLGFSFSRLALRNKRSA